MILSEVTNTAGSSSYSGPGPLTSGHCGPTKEDESSKLKYMVFWKQMNDDLNSHIYAKNPEEDNYLSLYLYKGLHNQGADLNQLWINNYKLWRKKPTCIIFCFFALCGEHICTYK